MDLTKNNGLNLKSEASDFFLFECEEDLLKIIDHAESCQKNLQVIGSGTNTVFPRYFTSVVIKSTNNNFEFIEEVCKINNISFNNTEIKINKYYVSDELKEKINTLYKDDFKLYNNV